MALSSADKPNIQAFLPFCEMRVIFRVLVNMLLVEVEGTINIGDGCLSVTNFVRDFLSFMFKP